MTAITPSLGAVPTHAPTTTAPTTTTQAASVRAADGDYKTRGPGHDVKDSDGDYKPSATLQVGAATAAATSSNAVRGVLLDLPKGGL